MGSRVLVSVSHVRADQQVYVLRHEDVGPEVESVLLFSGGEGVDQIATSAVLR
jgi:hypothetical protein